MSVHHDITEVITIARVIPVLTVESPDAAVHVCRALHAGGIPIAEITFRTPSAAECIRAAVDALPEMIIGAGTVLRPEQADAAKAAGAQFLVAPGLNPHVVRHANTIGLPMIPGVCTPTEIEAALELSKTLLKFFPAEASGGLKMLSALAAPYIPAGVRFIPTGGITPDNLRDYLAHPAVAAVGGTWLATPALIQAADWPAIEQNARAVTQRIQWKREGGAPARPHASPKP
ncbi:MAG: bifunctional 4-hydroxy-2-oxoglutarate aldolase/2-dehydro-3-deoxy-phosphogluconate aldolase [Candidatus Hydrogenedentales bacterium]